MRLCKAGDTILLRSGYHGEIYCRGACNDDYITIAAQKGHTPRVRRIFFSAAAKWIIRGLTVSCAFAPTYQRDRLIYVVDWGGPSSDFIIENNTLCSDPEASSWSAEEWNRLVCYGISVIGKRIKIRNNTLKYVNHGIVITGDRITVERNSIEHIAGSPALAPKTDIGGVRRPQGAGIDIGPYEFEDIPAQPTK